MNKFLFLPPTSCHPPHIFKGWITGYGRRLRLNCSNDKDFEDNLSAFKSRLLARGYSETTIQNAFDKIPNRRLILNSVTTSAPKKLIGVPFVITYSPEIKEVMPHIKHALSLKEEAYLDPHFPQIFGTRTTPMISFKRGKNLKDIVSPSALKTNKMTIPDTQIEL